MLFTLISLKFLLKIIQEEIWTSLFLLRERNWRKKAKVEQSPERSEEMPLLEGTSLTILDLATQPLFKNTGYWVVIKVWEHWKAGKVTVKWQSCAVQSSGSRVSETTMSSITTPLPSQHNNEGKETDWKNALCKSLLNALYNVLLQDCSSIYPGLYFSCKNSFLFQWVRHHEKFCGFW